MRRPYLILNDSNRILINSKLKKKEGFLIIGRFGYGSCPRLNIFEDFTIDIYKSCRIKKDETNSKIQKRTCYMVSTNRGKNHKDDIYFDVRVIRKPTGHPSEIPMYGMFSVCSIRNFYEVKPGVMASVGQIGTNLTKDCSIIYIPWGEQQNSEPLRLIIDHFTSIINKSLKETKIDFQFSSKDKKKILDYVMKEFKSRKDCEENFSFGQMMDRILD